MNTIEALLLSAEAGGLPLEVAAKYLKVIARPEHHTGIDAALRHLLEMPTSMRASLRTVARTRIDTPGTH